MSTETLNKRFNWALMMILVTVFQIITSTPAIIGESFNVKLAGIFAAYIAVEWLYLFIASNFCGQNNFEFEIIGFLLSGIGLVVSASVYDDFALKQFLCIIAGIAGFIALLLILRRTDIVMKLRMPIAFAAIALLAVNLLLAEYNNGARNWIEIGGISLQPSEFVKLAFVFVGAASLDKLQNSRSLTRYLIFSFTCVGAMFLMRDFGAALIFFFTFVIIAFMRSGDVRTIALVCVGAALGAIMIMYFSATVADRFSTYRHIWEKINDEGMQQTRVLIYSASGGLFGLGIGMGMVRGIFASTTDLVFGMLCEEWGMLIGFAVAVTYMFILAYAVKVARVTRSAFYAIAACAAAGLMLFQAALNIFGVTDILPFTGVTLPFISRGGSSVICSWGLLAFIKSADIRTYPKLSKTILPDHPLYPPSVKIGRGRRRPVTPPSKVVGQPLTDSQMRQNAARSRQTMQSTPKRSSSTAKDVPISKAKKSTVTSQTNRKTSSAKDVPISKKTSNDRRTKR